MKYKFMNFKCQLYKVLCGPNVEHKYKICNKYIKENVQLVVSSTFKHHFANTHAF